MNGADGLVNVQLWHMHNALRAVAEGELAHDATLRASFESVLPAIWLFACLVERLEERWQDEWVMTEDPRAQRGLRVVASLQRAWLMAKAGKLSGVKLMARAATTRAELKKELAVAAPDRVHLLDEPKPEGRRTLVKYRDAAGKLVTLDLGILRRTSFEDAYSWRRGTPHLRGKYDRTEESRRPGRPKRYRDDARAVLEAVQLAPGGITIGALCKAISMRKQLATLAYKELVEDGVLRIERRGARRQVFLFPNSPME